jgi:predicted GNAT superfamily acetyltransferase
MNDEVVSVSVLDAGRSGLLGQSLLALNNADAQQLSLLDAERLEYLVERAFVARRIGEVDAFVLALDQDADYASPNFQWFRARYERFVYVDRVVVASCARGRGYARRLYRDVFDHALRAGHHQVFCEVNSRPPNPESDAFHAALGFSEVGSASVYDDTRTVRYLSCPLR